VSKQGSIFLISFSVDEFHQERNNTTAYSSRVLLKHWYPAATLHGFTTQKTDLKASNSLLFVAILDK